MNPRTSEGPAAARPSDPGQAQRRTAQVRRPLRYRHASYLLPLVFTPVGLFFYATEWYPLFGLGITSGIVVTVIGSALAVLAPVWLLRQWLRRPVRVVAEQGVVRLGGQTLPLGKGRLSVSLRELRTRRSELWVYDVSHEYGGVETQLYRHCDDPVQVREWAEGVCRLGGWSLAWIGPGGREVRSPDELDKPLLYRLKDDPKLLERPPGRPSGVRMQQVGPGGGLRLRHDPPSAASLAATMGASWGLGLLMALLEAPEGKYLVFGLAGLGFGTVVGAGLVFKLAALGEELVVEPGALTWRREVFGHVVLEKRIPVAHLESIYLERRQQLRLVLAGDGFHLHVGHFDELAAALVVRWAIYQVLVGRKPDLDTPSLRIA